MANSNDEPSLFAIRHSIITRRLNSLPVSIPPAVTRLFFDLHPTTGYNIVHEAILTYHIGIVRWVLNNVYDFNQSQNAASERRVILDIQTREGLTPFALLFLHKGHGENQAARIVPILLAYARIEYFQDIRERQISSPDEADRFLLERLVTFHSSKIGLTSVLHVAAATNTLSSFRTLFHLLSKTKFVQFVQSFRDHHGRTVMHVCAFADSHDLLSYIDAIGCNVITVAFQQGWTPMHCAAAAGSLKCIRVLMQCGAYPGELYNARGESVLNVAENYQQWRIVQELLPSYTPR